MERISGIYCIENLVNHKKYVGKSVDIYRRWESEKCGLRGSYFHNRHLQRAWDKYGSDNFAFNIIETCPEEVLAEREIYWIAKLNTYHTGYNQTVGGEGTTGVIISEERRKRMCESNKGKNNKPVYCFELKKEFWGAKEAEDQLRKLYGVRKNGVSMCCNGSRSYSGKTPTGLRLHWCFADQKDSYKIPLLLGKEKPVYCYELDTVFESCTSAQNDPRILKAQSGCLAQCCTGNPRHKTCGKLHDGTRLTWRYATYEEIEELQSHMAGRS